MRLPILFARRHLRGSLTWSVTKCSIGCSKMFHVVLKVITLERLAKPVVRNSVVQKNV
jgi:hypothetical protein